MFETLLKTKLMVLTNMPNEIVGYDTNKMRKDTF